MVWKIVWTLLFIPCAAMVILAVSMMVRQFVRGYRRYH